MVKKKDSFWKYAKELENSRFFCLFCKKDFAGGISRSKSHLSGVKGRDIEVCQKVPDDIKLEALQAIGTPTKRAKSMAASNPTKRTKSMAASNNVLRGESVSGSSSCRREFVPNLCKGHDQSIVDKQLAKFMMSDRICSDTIQLPFFKDFVNGVAEHGPRYQLPSSFALQSQWMLVEKEVEEYTKNVRKHSVKTGCTLMYYKWPSEKFMDIFAYTPIGMACMDPPKAYMLNLFGEVLSFQETMTYTLELIGPTNVVQFIINDDDGDYDNEVRSTMDKSCRDYPWIYRTPCATRGIGLLLAKIYDCPFVWNTIQVAKWIVLYIYKHKVNVPLRRVHIKEGVIAPDLCKLTSLSEEDKEDIIASNFSMLTSLLEVESELQALQVSIGKLSSDWGKPVDEKKMENFINYAIPCKEFWSRAKMAAKVMRPILQALCLVRCDGPTSGYLYEMMESVEDAVEQCCDSYHSLNGIWKILDEVRSDIIHPIHAAAAFLNPTYMCSDKFEERNEMTDGVNYILERLVTMEEKKAFMKQVKLYRMKDSNVFTAEAMMMLKTSHPGIWWELYGDHLPVLKRYAIRILSQPCSSSLCRRYKLRHGRVYNHASMMNTMMMERYKSLEIQMKEPIILDKLGEISDDVNQHFWDEACGGNNAYSFEIFTDSNIDEIITDPTGSWLDRWPKDRIESSE